MALPSFLFFIIFSASFVSGYLFEASEAFTRRTDREQRSSISDEGNRECQEGSPPGDPRGHGVNYSGRMNVTITGRTCQFWNTSEPHDHDYTDLGGHNYCRNPDGDNRGAWCYTTDPNRLRESCFVPRCEATHDCQEELDGGPLGEGYSGDVNVTITGIPCKAWNDTYFKGLAGEQNHCRSPNKNLYSGVFCYTTDPNVRWEICDVPVCKQSVTYDCQDGDPLGVTYRGTMNVTVSGKTCQSWSATEPHSHGFRLGDHNHCRNPLGNRRPGGIW